MTFIVYILQSERTGLYYVGQTNDLTQRLVQHNKGQVQSTKLGRPWKLIHYEQFPTRSEAIQRERQIKARKKRHFIEEVVSQSIPERSAAR